MIPYSWNIWRVDILKFALKIFYDLILYFFAQYLSKQSHPPHHSVCLFFPKFEKNIIVYVCSVETLKAYEEKTLSFHKDS